MQEIWLSFSCLMKKQLMKFRIRTVPLIVDLSESYVLLIFFNTIVGEFHTYKFLLPYFAAELYKENIIFKAQFAKDVFSGLRSVIC